MKLISLFTTDTVTLSYTYIFLGIIRDLSEAEGKGDFQDCVIKSVRKGLEYLHDNQHRIFNFGYNPDSFIEEIKILITLLDRLPAVNDIVKAEKIICESVNTRMKSPVARGSVNFP
jgi:hypothetical protein